MSHKLIRPHTWIVCRHVVCELFVHDDAIELCARLSCSFLFVVQKLRIIRVRAGQVVSFLLYNAPTHPYNPFVPSFLLRFEILQLGFSRFPVTLARPDSGLVKMHFPRSPTIIHLPMTLATRYSKINFIASIRSFYLVAFTRPSSSITFVRYRSNFVPPIRLPLPLCLHTLVHKHLFPRVSANSLLIVYLPSIPNSTWRFLDFS